jgi:hypothetical protein
MSVPRESKSKASWVETLPPPSFRLSGQVPDGRYVGFPFRRRGEW